MTSARSLDKESGVVNIVQNKDPLPFIFVLQPVVNELRNIGGGIPPTGDLDFVCNFPIALFKPGSVARVDPENPCFGGLISDSIRVFDGKLRLSSRS